jgi:hypothetical protein
MRRWHHFQGACVPRLTRTLAATPGSARQLDPSPSRTSLPTGAVSLSRSTAVAGWLGMAFVVGVVKDVLIGNQFGTPAVELRLSVIEFSQSTLSVQCERMEMRVVSTLSDGVQAASGIHRDSVVHVVGKPVLKPSYNVSSQRYDFTHEIQVSDDCGSIVPVFSQRVCNGKT